MIVRMGCNYMFASHNIVYTCIVFISLISYSDDDICSQFFTSKWYRSLM